MARACREAGYTLIVITDHFFNANIGCERDLPWEDKVEYLTRGYRAAKGEGDRIGLKVLFGWETFNAGPEFLTYGLGTDFLLDNPDIADITAGEYLQRVKAANGFVIHAHPFRKAPYIPEFIPDWASVEAFEVYNAGNKDREYDRLAFEMAKEHGLIMTAGSDAHSTDKVRGGAMEFDGDISTSGELIAAIRSRAGRLIELL